MAEEKPTRRPAPRFAVLTILVLIATVLSALATRHWIAELFSHFTPYYAALALLCLLGLLIARVWRWAALALALTLWNGYPVARALQQGAPSNAAAASTNGRTVTVLHFNIGAEHEQPQRVVSYLQRRAKNVDVVILLEASTDFDLALDELKAQFPHQISHLENTPFGIALLSKHPLTGSVSFLPERRFPHIEATVKLPGRKAPLALYAVHAPPPLSEAMAKARKQKLDHIALSAAELGHETPIVAGDFNVTPWSPYFARFSVDSGLNHAHIAHRFEHTWPVIFDNAVIGLALDHTFAHPSLRLTRRTVGPDLGSDHFPVTATFSY